MRLYIEKQLTLPAAAVTPETEKELKAALGLRRLPPGFAVLGAGALELLKSEPAAEREEIGLLFVSRFGPVGGVMNFMTDLELYPPDQTGPGHFSNSVFNAPAFYLSKLLGTRGPILCSGGTCGAETAALQTAGAYIGAGLCRKFALVFADEDGAFLRRAAQFLTAPAFSVPRFYLLSGADNGVAAEDDEFFHPNKEEVYHE